MEVGDLSVVVSSAKAFESLSITGVLFMAVAILIFTLRDKRKLDDAMSRIATAMEQNNVLNKTMMEFLQDSLMTRLEEIRSKQDRLIELSYKGKGRDNDI